MQFQVDAHRTDRPAGRIRQQNEKLILEAAEQEFARHGFKGTSMQQVADRAGLPKANIHYYFNNKLGLYYAVLANIIDLWDSTFNELSADDDPAEVLPRYIATKIDFSRRYPQASRVFAMEILSGGPHLSEYFEQDYRDWFRARAAVFEQWIAAGKMKPVDPAHLIFLLWGATQHYADFAVQIEAALGRPSLEPEVFETATRTLTDIILDGCGIRRKA